ncbi:MAG: hypothetical protein M3530_01155 [Thermoproteota archaeon]|nr:hypothetical protein [Thermoproteota archaeon]
MNTEERDIILGTIGQLCKFIDMMDETENSFDETEYRLMKILGSVAKRVTSRTRLIAQNEVTKESISK